MPQIIFKMNIHKPQIKIPTSIVNQYNYSKKYTFIHPTKTGGTSCERFFKKYYPTYIQGEGHNTKCTNNNKPIIIVRDIYDRFLSMYYYWKNGAIDTRFKRDKDFINKYNNITIKQFIELIKNKKHAILFKKFTWDRHFWPITNWINNTKYENIIIIKYEKNLNEKIQTLLNTLKIPNKNILLPKVNISNRDNKEELDEEDKEFVKTYFKTDFELIETIETSPHLFKLVI